VGNRRARAHKRPGSLPGAPVAGTPQRCALGGPRPNTDSTQGVVVFSPPNSCSTWTMLLPDTPVLTQVRVLISDVPARKEAVRLRLVCNAAGA
jgi:hypothetical protein